MKAPLSNVRPYVAIWAALLALLVATWAVAQVDLGPWNMAAAMAIAIMKMALVMFFFMHAHRGPRVKWAFVAAGFFWLALMVSLTMTDYLSRWSYIETPLSQP